MDTQPLLRDLAHARGFFLRLLQRTPEDKLEWLPDAPPEGHPTTALDIARHCIAMEERVGGRIAGESQPEWTPALAEASYRSGAAAHARNTQELTQVLAEVGKRTDAAIEAAPADRWQESVAFPPGAISVESYAWVLVAHWYYHAGQLGYLQRCWGDLEM